MVDRHRKDQSAHWYFVKMQVAKEEHLEKRALFYATSLYLSQVKRADHMDRPRPTLFAAPLNFNLFPDLPKTVLTILCASKKDPVLESVWIIPDA